MASHVIFRHDSSKADLAAVQAYWRYVHACEAGLSSTSCAQQQRRVLARYRRRSIHAHALCIGILGTVVQISRALFGQNRLRESEVYCCVTHTDCDYWDCVSKLKSIKLGLIEMQAYEHKTITD